MKKAADERRQIEEANAKMREYFEQMKAQEMEKVEEKPKEEAAMKMVLFILFKIHHLLRTKCLEGIYSVHGTEYVFCVVILSYCPMLTVYFCSQLSLLEKLIKAVPYTNYMKILRKEYNALLNSTREPKQYIFKSKKLQHLEDMIRMSRMHEKKKAIDVDKCIHKKE